MRTIHLREEFGDCVSKMVVRDMGGAQILPPIRDDRAYFSTWVALCALDADLRTKALSYTDLAGNLFIHGGDA